MLALAVLSAVLHGKAAYGQYEAAMVFAVASPSVVVVTTDTGALGSAVAYLSFSDRKGTALLTNCHVLVGATALRISQKGREAAASFLYGDVEHDLCVIGTSMVLPQAGSRNFLDLQVGEAVYAVGAPRGLELSITSGIVSAKRGSPLFPPMLIQTNAQISVGSSGGGLFDSRGRLIGIMTFALKDSQGLNFALAINMANGLSLSPSARKLEDLRR